MFIETFQVHFGSRTQCSLLFYAIKNVCMCVHVHVRERDFFSVLVAALPQIHQMLSDDENMHEKRFDTLYDKQIPTLPLMIL
jgi:hypothetical protein